MTYRLLLATTLAAITYLATTSRHFPIVETVSDKVDHIAAFYVLGLLVDFSWPESGFRLPKVIALLGYGMSIEIIQYFLPHRHFSIYDLGADAAGLLIYAGSVPLLKHIYPLNERFLAQERDANSRPG
jgi:VanZ family protein